MKKNGISTPHIFGKICKKHPELMGERYFCQSRCVGCSRTIHAAFYRANSEKYKRMNRENYAGRREERKIKDAAYHAKNREKRIAQSRARFLANKQSYRDSAKKWGMENKERKAKKNKAWYTANYERFVASVKNNIILRKRLIGAQSLSKKYSKELRAIYLNCPPGHHVDHIIPLRGQGVNGLHVPWNLQYLPAKENMSKGNRVEAHDGL